MSNMDPTEPNDDAELDEDEVTSTEDDDETGDD